MRKLFCKRSPCHILVQTARLFFIRIFIAADYRQFLISTIVTKNPPRRIFSFTASTLLDIFVSRNAATLATHGLSKAIGINRCELCGVVWKISSSVASTSFLVSKLVDRRRGKGAGPLVRKKAGKGRGSGLMYFLIGD
jgi:hypothetical protein